MSWVKLEEGFPEHPKVRRVGLLGLALHVSAICYCNRNLTDGYVPANEIVHLSGLPLRRTADLVTLLLEAGLWEECSAGYHIHDYLDYQPSRADVIKERAERREIRARAGRKGAETRWQNGGK